MIRGIHGRAHATGLACVRRIFCNVCVCDIRCPRERGGMSVSLCMFVCLCAVTHDNNWSVYTMATDGLEPIALFVVFAATYAAGTQNVPAVVSRTSPNPTWLPLRELFLGLARVRHGPLRARDRAADSSASSRAAVAAVRERSAASGVVARTRVDAAVVGCRVVAAHRDGAACQRRGSASCARTSRCQSSTCTRCSRCSCSRQCRCCSRCSAPTPSPPTSALALPRRPVVRRRATHAYAWCSS